MNTLFRVGSELVDVNQLIDQQLIIGGQLEKEFDVHVPFSVQVDSWDDAWYDSLYREAA